MADTWYVHFADGFAASDSAAVTDSASVSRFDFWYVEFWVGNSTVTESLALTDSATVHVTYTIGGDSGLLGDEDWTVTDAASVQVLGAPTPVSASDSGALTDAAALVATILLSASDSFGMTDSGGGVSGPPGSTGYVNASDAVTLTDLAASPVIASAATEAGHIFYSNVGQIVESYAE